MDVNFLRKESGKVDLVKESQRRRGLPIADIDEVIRLDDLWREARHALNLLQKEFNSTSELVPKEKSAQQKLLLIQRSKELKAQLPEAKERERLALEARDDRLANVGNLVHQLTPISIQASDNTILKCWSRDSSLTDSTSANGPNRRSFHPAVLRPHHELLYLIGGYEPVQGEKVAGERGYFLTGMGLMLNNAILQYALHFLMVRDCLPVQSPSFMKQYIMRKSVTAEELSESLYEVSTVNEKEETERLYLVSSLDQSLCAMNKGKQFTKKGLPARFAGFSTIFSKSLNSFSEHDSRETTGLIDLHQMEAVEQFVVSHPDESWLELDSLLKVSEDFMRSLELDFRVVDIVSGNLPLSAARQINLEAWWPACGRYRAIASCANCTDFQARRFQIKFSSKTADEPQGFAHTLNATLCHSERTMACILENYQTEKGITIPNVLKPFLAPFVFDTDFIPFTRDPIGSL